jgi:hypothetical protein
MRRFTMSSPDIHKLATLMVRAAEANRDQLTQWGLEPLDLQKGLGYFQNASQRHEQARTAMQISTAAYRAARKALREEMERWVAVLETNYGPSGEKLKEFGIMPRPAGPPAEQKAGPGRAAEAA